MFGALLGTLQKFRQEENQLKEKVWSTLFGTFANATSY